MEGPHLTGDPSRALAPSRILTSIALGLAILVWLGPLSSEAITPVDRKTSAALPCVNKTGTAYKARTAPKRCAHFGEGGAFAGGVDLHSLVWQDWGEPKVHGAGMECAFDADCQPIPVSVLAYRVRVRCGRPVYTRLRARTSLGTELIKTRACLGAA